MDTSAARKAILSRIREAQGRSPEPTATEYAAVSAYLSAHPAGPRPTVGPDLVEHFRAQALRMSDTVDVIGARQDIPAAVARYLSEQDISMNGVAWPGLSDLEWTREGLDLAFRRPRDEDLVGITGCFCAIAETGTLLLLSGPDSWPSTSLLPETHIAIVPASRIVAHMEEAFALARDERGELPRATNFISGPSRTGDIEQTIVLGAHGPYRVHVIIVLGA